MCSCSNVGWISVTDTAYWIGSSPNTVVRSISRGEFGSYGAARCSTPRLSQMTVSPTDQLWL